MIFLKNYAHIWASLKLTTVALLPLMILGMQVIRPSFTIDLAALINLATSINLATFVHIFMNATTAYFKWLVFLKVQ